MWAAGAHGSCGWGAAFTTCTLVWQIVLRVSLAQLAVGVYWYCVQRHFWSGDDMSKQAEVRLWAKRSWASTWLISRSQVFKLNYPNAIRSFHFIYKSKNLSCCLVFCPWPMCTSAALTEPKLSGFRAAPASPCLLTFCPIHLSFRNLTTKTEDSKCWSHVHACTCIANMRSAQTVYIPLQRSQINQNRHFNNCKVF